jgi:hypothetical protein
MNNIKVFTYNGKIYCFQTNNYFFELYIIEEKLKLLKKFRHTFFEIKSRKKELSFSLSKCFEYGENITKEEKITRTIFGKYKLFYKNKKLYFLNLDNFEIKKIRVTNVPLIVHNNDYILIKSNSKIDLYDKNLRKISVYNLNLEIDNMVIIDDLIYFSVENKIYAFDINFTFQKKYKLNNIYEIFNSKNYLILSNEVTTSFFTKDLKYIDSLNIPNIDNVFEIENTIFLKSNKKIYQINNFKVLDKFECDDLIYHDGKIKQIIYNGNSLIINNKTYKLPKIKNSLLFSFLENLLNYFRNILVEHFVIPLRNMF